MPSGNIYDLIIDSTQNPRMYIWSGHEADVYKLNDPEFLKKYVIRAERDCGNALEALDPDDTIYPVDEGQPKSIAPAIARTGGGITFHPRQANMISLKHWYSHMLDYYKQHGSKHPANDAYSFILSALSKIGSTKYEKLLTRTLKLANSGRSIDKIGDNLMASKSSLRWVDYKQDDKGNCLEDIASVMLGFDEGAHLREMVPADIASVIELRRNAVLQKLHSAAKATHFPLREKDITRQMRLAFGAGSRVEHVQTIKMHHSRAKLLELFQQVEESVGWNSVERS